MDSLHRLRACGLILLCMACAQPAGDGLEPPPADTPPGSPPSAPPGSLANECRTPSPGWIWCDDFDVDRLASYYGYGDAGGRFVRVPGTGTEGSVAMRSRFTTAPQSSSGSLNVAFGKVPMASFRPVDAGTARYREIYWRLYLRHDAAWVGGGGDKLSRATSFVSSTNWAQAMIAHVWSGTGSRGAYLVIDPASGTDSAGVVRSTTYNDFPNLRWLGGAHGTTPLFATASLGRWHCIEAHVRLNDPGASNGQFRLWVNGQLDAERTGLNWVGSYAEYGINAVLVENYWNDGSPVEQERFIDNLVVSTQPIGCPA